MLFCPKTVSQDNRGTSSLTDEAEHVMSGRMSNKSLEMEQVLLIRQKAFAAVRLIQGVTDLGLFSGTGKHFTQNPYHIRNWIFFFQKSVHCMLDLHMVCPWSCHYYQDRKKLSGDGFLPMFLFLLHLNTKNEQIKKTPKWKIFFQKLNANPDLLPKNITRLVMTYPWTCRT